ncbi:MAG: protoglobin domain-containing protein, partial [Gemmatimonas sp.]
MPAGRITVSDAAVRERVDFLGVTERDLGVIKHWGDSCMAACDPMIDAFYAKIMAQRDTRAIISEHTSIERQRPLITRYLKSMLAGVVDDDYLAYRRTV